MGSNILPQVQICLIFKNGNDEYSLYTDQYVDKYCIYDRYTGVWLGRPNIIGECLLEKVLLVQKYESEKNWNIVEEIDIPDGWYEYKDEKDFIRVLRDIFGAIGLVQSNCKGGVCCTRNLVKMINRSIAKNKAKFKVPEFASSFNYRLHIERS